MQNAGHKITIFLQCAVFAHDQKADSTRIGLFCARMFQTTFKIPSFVIPPRAGFFMKNFKPKEFQGWYEHINLDLLQMLQDFRDCWGQPVYISPAHGAVGRQLGPHSKSYHNYDRWGEVRALDIIPTGLFHAVSAIEADRLFRHCGITGIGFYPHWQRYSNKQGKMVHAPGFHIDNRPRLARWGAIKENGRQIYVTFEAALVKMDNE